MKLGKHEFARLVAHIQGFMSNGKKMLSNCDIEDIDNLIDFHAPEVQTVYANDADVNELMRVMASGIHKIEAIKLHRKLTGWGLKESKDQIEKYWVSKAVAPDYIPDNVAFGN